MKKQRIHRWVSILLGLLLCLSLAACGNRKETQEAAEETSATPMGTEITCYADFSNGSETAEEDGLIQTEKRTVTEVNPDTLAEEASESEENTEIVDMGDTENYKRTEGTFWLDADPDSGYLKMDGEGDFWIYNASGELETEGYLIDEEDSDVRYKMYLSDGEYFDTLYCKGAMEMHFLESGAYYDRTPGLETDEAW